jgi:hypothetical protein
VIALRLTAGRVEPLAKGGTMLNQDLLVEWDFGWQMFASFVVVAMWHDSATSSHYKSAVGWQSGGSE